MIWRSKIIMIGEEDLGSHIKDTPKNKRTIESISILISRVLDLKNEIAELDNKLEV